MTELVFVLPGKPQAKQRPRFAKGRAFTPKETVNFEALVKMMTIEAMEKQGWKITDAPLHVNISIWLLPPQSKPKWWKQALHRIGATVAPDVDNVAKAITDAMNGIAYADDRQIVQLTVTKCYGSTEHTIVRVETSDRWEMPSQVTRNEYLAFVADTD